MGIALLIIYWLGWHLGIYFLLRKAGVDNTKALIPIYNTWEVVKLCKINQFWFWLSCTTVAINVQESFPLVCLDFDNVEIFFHKEFNNIELLKFLNILKLNNCLVLSSPVDRAMN